MTPFQQDVIDRLARLEEKLDARADHETRIRALERFRWIVVGLAAAVSAITQYVTTWPGSHAEAISPRVPQRLGPMPRALAPGAFFVATATNAALSGGLSTSASLARVALGDAGQLAQAERKARLMPGPYIKPRRHFCLLFCCEPEPVVSLF
jgi:hypothetical protein